MTKMIFMKDTCITVKMSGKVFEDLDDARVVSFLNFMNHMPMKDLTDPTNRAAMLGMWRGFASSVKMIIRQGIMQKTGVSTEWKNHVLSTLQM